MVFLLDGAGLLLLGLWVFCLIDVITTDEFRCRNLPKTVWLLIVLILPDVGSIIWLVAGRPRTVSGPVARLAEREADRHRGAGRPVRASANPDDDEDFLRGLRERAEEQRRKAREQQRRPEEE